MGNLIQISQMSDWEKRHMYIENMTPLLNRSALFSDGTKEYRFPPEPMPFDEVTIRFRTALGNVDSVCLIANGEKYEMEKAESDTLFDYYKAVLPLKETQVSYYFEIYAGAVKCFFDKKGVQTEPPGNYNFVISPGFQTPDWAKGAVIYQIYVDRFYKGDSTNSVETDEYSYIGEHVEKVIDWNKYPAQMGVREFYGGDLTGVYKKLDYLQELGVEVIYFNPIFVSPSNHKYDIQDYDYIDPHFGKIVKDEGELLAPGDQDNAHASRYKCRITNKENLEASNQFFSELVAEIHRRGMRVILDGVFNHCGSYNKWMDRERIYENESGYEKGAYISGDSPYRSFFKFREEAWPYNDKYDGWWGHDTLPKLNYEESQKLHDYILNIGKKWVSEPYNVDGWRLDVAADLGHSNEYNHHFWKEFRKAVKEANPEAIILAEHYGDSSFWLQGDEWDTVMNYDAFMEPVTWFLTGVDKHSDEFRGDMMGNSRAFWDAMNHFMSRFNTQSLQVAMNELSNHDHSRFLTRTNYRVGRTSSLGPQAASENLHYGLMRAAVLIQMTWPGAPTVYYGDEAGLTGWTDPDNRRTYPWGHEDKEMLALHKELIRIHKDYSAIKTGSLIYLGGEQNFISYGRFDKKDKLVIAVNRSETEIQVDIPVWQIGITDEERLCTLITTTADGFSLQANMYQTIGGFLHLVLGGMSAVIIKNIVY